MTSLLEKRFAGIVRCIDSNLRIGIELESRGEGGYFTAVGFDATTRRSEGIYQVSVGVIDPRLEPWERLESRKATIALSRLPSEKLLLLVEHGTTFGGAAVKVPGAIISLWGLDATESLAFLLFSIALKEKGSSAGVFAEAKRLPQRPALADLLGILTAGMHATAPRSLSL